MDNQKQSTVAMPKLLTVSPSPHAKREMTTARLMIDVLIALAPATVWGIVAFGWRAALVVLTCVASCVFFEFLIEKILRRRVTVSDFSAAVTGLLLGLNLSPSVPFYVPVIASAFAIIVVKQLFGGIGMNVMNPALAARVFVLLAWPGVMSAFPDAFAWLAPQAADAVATATPLVALKSGATSAYSLLDLFLGRTPGCIGEISALMLLIGGIYLICKRVITWHIPVSFLGTVATLTFLFPRGDGARWEFMLASLCSGGLMIAAFFMATDYVTSPVTKKGKLIYGTGCGLLLVFLRYFSGYPEGASFAILIMNTVVWYLDMATKPRVYGKSRREKRGGGANG